LSFEPEITLNGKCPACGEAVSFKAYLMKAYKDRHGEISYTDSLNKDEVEVAPKKEFYFYDFDCPKCGRNMEGVLGPKS
jgi:rRNA maturation protein Nop10